MQKDKKEMKEHEKAEETAEADGEKENGSVQKSSSRDGKDDGSSLEKDSKNIGDEKDQNLENQEEEDENADLIGENEILKRL